MELLVLLAVIIVIGLGVVFKKQIQAKIIKAKRTMDDQTETSIKIDQTIAGFRKKQAKAKETFKLINKSSASLEIQAIRELATSIEMEPLKVTVGAPHTSNDGTSRLEVGEPYYVRKFDREDPLWFDIGLPKRWNRNLFDCHSTQKNMVRYVSIMKLMAQYERRAGTTEELINTIESSIKSLINDKDYVRTMEGLIELEDFDIDMNISTITAEISALEKQLEMEEKLNGHFDEDSVVEQSNSK